MKKNLTNKAPYNMLLDRENYLVTFEKVTQPKNI